MNHEKQSGNGASSSLSREEKRQRLLDAYNEAKEEIKNPNAEFCDDPAKLHDFLLK